MRTDPVGQHRSTGVTRISLSVESTDTPEQAEAFIASALVLM